MRAWLSTRKGLFELERRGAADWRIARVHFLAEPVTALLPPDAEGFMLAALNLGHFGVKLHASDDAGRSWHERPAPAFPPQPEGAPGPSWTLRQIWTLARDAGGRVWAGTLPGGLFASGDRGASWQLNEALWHRPERQLWFGGGYDTPGIHSLCPHPQQPDELFIGVSCGGALHSADGGATWAQRTEGMRADFMPPEQAADADTQDPHRIARCAAQPTRLWCQHHCGIWVSSDTGASWQRCEAQPSSFGFAVAAHPGDPDTAWFAPALKDEKRLPVDAALCVTRTRDGGRSFEALRQGLPQTDCYDLIYRHGLEVAADGRSLLLGSTTGHLWASGDGGEHWQAVALNLPPIYAVHFG
jgi:hypothetical protein